MGIIRDFINIFTKPYENEADLNTSAAEIGMTEASIKELMATQNGVKWPWGNDKESNIGKDRLNLAKTDYRGENVVSQKQAIHQQENDERGR